MAETVKKHAQQESFLDTVVEQVRSSLDDVALSYAESGRSLADLGSAKQIAARMLAAVPSPSDWDELLGPFFSTSKVTQLMGGVSRQAVTDRRKRRTLLGLRTLDGAIVYPVFQFDAQNEILPGLADVLRCFAADDVDDWTMAGWLVAPQRALGGFSVIKWLASGRSVEKAIDLARAQAGRYAQ